FGTNTERYQGFSREREVARRIAKTVSVSTPLASAVIFDAVVLRGGLAVTRSAKAITITITDRKTEKEWLLAFLAAERSALKRSNLPMNILRRTDEKI